MRHQNRDVVSCSSRHQWPGHPHREIQPRFGQCAGARIMKVVHDVDATAERRLTVDDTDLAMQPTPAAGHDRAP